jgi:hypothetical protein
LRSADIRYVGRGVVEVSETTNTDAGRGAPSRECDGDGWASFNHPAAFADQGKCVAYVNDRPQIPVLVPEDPIQ